MPKQDLFKNYYRNPNKKYIDSGVICPECDSKENDTWKIIDGAVVSTNGTDTTKLLDLSDVASPIDKVETGSVISTPKSTTILDGITREPQLKSQFFSLYPAFGNDITDPRVGGIPYNTDLEFDLMVPGFIEPEKLKFEADPNREYPILQQVNDYFACIGAPIVASIESTDLDNKLCGQLDQSDHKRCLEQIKKKKEGKLETDDLPFLVFRSTAFGYEFEISNPTFYQKILSDTFPTSPYIGKGLGAGGKDITIKIGHNVLYNYIDETVTEDSLTAKLENPNKIAVSPVGYKVTLDRETGTIISKEPITTEITYRKQLEEKVYLFETACLRVEAFKYDESGAVSYSLKITYPAEVDATSQYVWLRHVPQKKEMNRLYEEYKEKVKDTGVIPSYDTWYRMWTLDTIEKGYWVPVNTLYIVLGTKDKLISPVLIYNPNSFSVKINQAKHS